MNMNLRLKAKTLHAR